jgi:N-acetylmuramoyl-L-alanine amidase
MRFGAGSRIWVDGSPDFGTAGCLVNVEGVGDRIFLVTAGHVVANSNVGDLLRASDSPDKVAVGPCIGRLAEWAPLMAAGTPVDLALIQVDPAKVSSAAGDGGAYAGTNPTPSVGLGVRCHGAGSGGMVTSTILGVDVDVLIPFGNDGASDWHVYPKQIVCDMFTLPGDSGAAVLDMSQRIVGFVAGVAPVPAGITSPTGYVTVVVPVLTAFSGGPWARLNLATQIPVGAVAPPGLDVAPVSPVEVPGNEVGSDIDVMARTMWAEARGDGPPGMTAVAAVIMNRLRSPLHTRYGRTVAGVCKRRKQFSCWNPALPDYQATAADQAVYQALLAVNSSDPDFRTALQIATEAVQGDLEDPTRGALNYVAAWEKQRVCNGSASVGNWICSPDFTPIGRQIYIRNVA